MRAAEQDALTAAGGLDDAVLVCTERQREHARALDQQQAADSERQRLQVALDTATQAADAAQTAVRSAGRAAAAAESAVERAQRHAEQTRARLDGLRRQ